MKFEKIFSRAGDDDLQKLIGKASLRLIYLLDGKVTPTKLSSIVLDIFSPAGLLFNKFQRDIIFDLLRRAEADELLQSLKGIKSEQPYEALKACRFPRSSVIEAKLFEFFEIVPSSDRLRTDILSHNIIAPTYALFPHQITALNNVSRLLSEQPHRVLLHMPTGSGKTRTAMNLITDHIRQNPRALVVWLASTEELCSQAMEEFQRAWEFLGNRNVDTYSFWGDSITSLDEIKNGFLVAGMAKTYSLAKRDAASLFKLAAKTTLVVMDEAHQSIADTYQIIIDALLSIRNDTCLLGLTATPGRTWNDPMEDQRLAKYYAHKKVMLHVQDYNSPVDYLIAEHFLAKPTFEKLLYNSGINLTQADLNSIASEFDFSAAVLGKLAEDEARNLAIIKRVENLIAKHTRIILFALNVEHSNLLACVLRSRGIKSDSITGASDGAVRENILKDFKSLAPTPHVICNFGVLTTGFDAPKTSCAVIARPTKSLVLYSQMVGRAIRGLKAGGNLEAEIVTVVDENLPGFSSVADAFVNWEDVWRKTE